MVFGTPLTMPTFRIVVILCFIAFSSGSTNASFNTSGPFTFEYLLGEDFNFETEATVIVVDYEVNAQVIGRLKDAGKIVLCYVSVGSYEEYRPDAHLFPPSVLGNDYEGWPGERWLDVRAIEILLPIMTSRFSLAASKGCQAIDPDNMQVYESDSGFDISKQQQVAYNVAILDAIRSKGMMGGIKNAGAQVQDLLPLAEFAVSEQCVQYDECELFDPFILNKKPVFVIEYTERWGENEFKREVCPLVESTGMSFILKHLDLSNDYTVSCL